MHVLRNLLFFHLLTCLGLNTLGSEIINGKKVPDNLMLYMASVQNKEGQHVCGGFLIDEEFVVTAAHCNKGKPVSVVLGTHNLKKVDDVTMRYSFKRCKHPSYLDVQRGNDIMLLKLSKKARLNKRVKTVKLPKPVMKIKDNEKCLVAGWGFTKTVHKAVDVLQVADVPFVNSEACERKWSYKLPDNVICTGGSKTHKGFCLGDSGGPLVCGKKAVGVVSFNIGKNCDYPNVYTDISKYLPWIKKIVEQKNCTTA